MRTAEYSYYLAPGDAHKHFVGSTTQDTFGFVRGKIPDEWRWKIDKHYVTAEEREAFIREAEVEIVHTELGGNATNSSRLMGNWSNESGLGGNVFLYTEVGRGDPIEELEAKLAADNVTLQLPKSMNEGKMVGGSLIVPVETKDGETDILVLSTSPEGSTHTPIRNIDRGVVLLDSGRTQDWRKTWDGVAQRAKENPKEIIVITSFGSRQLKEAGPEVADVLAVTRYFNGNVREVRKALHTLGVDARNIPPEQLAMELAVRGNMAVAMSRGGESSFLVTDKYVAEQPVAEHAVDPTRVFPLGMGDAKKGGTLHEIFLHGDIEVALPVGDIAGARTGGEMDSRSGHPTRAQALREVLENPYPTKITKRAA